jgi:imidazolonepropionase-like amidohydrolase
MAASIEAGKNPERNAVRVKRVRETVSRIRSRGVRVVPFGDYGIPDRLHGHNARDLRHFVRYLGFTPAEALRSATQWGGELMGQDRIGLVAPGFVADLLLVDGDPLTDLRLLEEPANLRMIMKGGVIHKELACAS